MKRYAFLTVIFLALVVAILLSSCTPAGEVVSATKPAEQATQPTAQPTATQPKPALEPTRIPTLAIPVTAPTQAAAVIEAEVTADGLNVRVGPGLHHRIMGKLAAGQKVRLEGRSQTSEWVVVRLADGNAGWVYSSYLRPSADLASLPMLEAYGGPLTSGPAAKPTAQPAKRYTLNVEINNNQAEINMAGFPAERDMTLRLTVPGDGPAMSVATAKTDDQGEASLTFDMPTIWPDGSAVTQSTLILQVLNADGKLLGKATIAFQSGE